MIILALFFLFSLLFAVFYPFTLTTLILSTAIFILVLLTLIFINIKYRQKLVLALIGTILGGSVGIYHLYAYQTAYAQLPITGNIQFKIQKIYPNYHSADAKVISPHQLQDYSIRIYNIPEDLQLGGTYESLLKLQPNQTKAVWHQISRRLGHLANRRIATSNIQSSINEIKQSNSITQLRSQISRQFIDSGYKNADIMSALSVGMTNDIPQASWDLLRKTGTIHLVSISGLHLTFIALWVFTILKIVFGLLNIQRRPAPYQIAALLSLIIVFLYAVMAGMSLPTQRALIMFSLLMTMLVIRYPISGKESLATALVIVLLISPTSVVTIGFWLSFSSVLVLIILNQYRFSLISSLLITQFIISLLAIPIVGSFFNEVSLISPLANLFAIPWTTTFILPPLLLGIVILPASQSLAELCFLLSDWSITQLMSFLEIMNKIPYSYIEIITMPLLSAILITILGIIILMRNKVWVKSACLFAIIMIFVSLMSKDEDHYLIVFPVGEGLSVFIKSGEETILFDTGSYYRGFDSAQSTILPTLKNLGVQQLNHIILSHDNRQHIGGTRSVRRKYRNAKIIAHPLLLNSLANGINCETFELLSDYLILRPLATEKSCAFSVTINHKVIWLIADISPLEWILLVKNELKPDIVLFPNQGRSKGYIVLKDWQDVYMIASTKNIYPDYRQLIDANAYTGIIKLNLTKPTIDTLDLDDTKRFWWSRHEN